MIFKGEKLVKLREDMGWSTYDIEHLTGIRQSVVSDLENGTTKNPRPVTVEKLCKGLKVSKEYFYLEDAKLPSEVIPDMPEETKRFIMNGNNVPYIMISEKAKKEGIPPEVLEKLLETLLESKPKIKGQP